MLGGKNSPKLSPSSSAKNPFTADPFPMFQLTSTPKTNEKPSTWYLPIGEFILGRGAKPHINLGNDLSISRQHATIRITPGKFQPTSKKSRFKIEIHDGVFKKATNTWKRSATGTLVNEVALGDEWKELKTSTTLKFASLIVSVFFRKGGNNLDNDIHGCFLLLLLLLSLLRPLLLLLLTHTGLCSFFHHIASNDATFSVHFIGVQLENRHL